MRTLELSYEKLWLGSSTRLTLCVCMVAREKSVVAVVVVVLGREKFGEVGGGICDSVLVVGGEVF